METAQIKQIIKRELPTIMQEDTEMQQFILDLSRKQFADKADTESRFDRILTELRQNREANQKKWEANQKEWEANHKQWDVQEEKWAKNQAIINQMLADNRKKWAAQEEKWQDQEEKWQDQEKKWAENQAIINQMLADNREKWAAQEEKWAENQAVINQMLADNRALSRRYDSGIGALGARWGLHAEQSFRNALKSILEVSFAVEVLNITEFDDDGVVFGRPDQIELDIIIKNGLLIICEIKSSMSRSDMYTFGRKIAFYEDRHNRKATRTLVISPMIEERAKQVAKYLDIEIFSYAQDMESL